MKFTNQPVFTEEDAKDKLIWERVAMMQSDLPLKSLLNYWSDTTGECHSFPIFKTDKPMDIINRYSDTYPMEYENLVEEVKNINESLYNRNGMSKERLNMAKLKIPIIVYRALMELDEHFWDNDKGLKWIEKNVKLIKVGKR